jgi:hypothetical protein
MSFPYYPKLQDEKLESLQTQHELLNRLRVRHLQWMNSATDSETEGMHQEIAGLLEQVSDRYNHLLADLLDQTDAE